MSAGPQPRPLGRRDPKKEGREQRSLLGVFVACNALPLVLCTVTATGCGLLWAFTLLHGDCSRFLQVRGKLLDADTSVGIPDAAVGGRSITDGEITASAYAPRYRNATSPASEDLGTFEVTFSTGFGPCTPEQEIPKPDLIEIDVVRDAFPQHQSSDTPQSDEAGRIRILCPCEQRFLIDVKEDQSVFSKPPDDSFVSGIVDLVNPIVVPPCVQCCAFLVLRGKLLDAETLVPISGARVGGDVRAEGERIGIVFESSGPRTGEDGEFEMRFSKVVGCPPAERFSQPDRVELTVVRDGCRKGFVIEINEDTVTPDNAIDDMAFLTDVIELQDPILVPPCGP